MNEQEYLTRLEQALKHASAETKQEALAFYRSYFAEGGIPTDPPEVAAQRILKGETMETIAAPPSPTANKSNFGMKLAIVLLTFPLWIGFFLAAVILVLAAWIVLLVVPLALLCSVPLLALVGILSLGTFLPQGLLAFGYALVAAALVMLLWKPSLLGIVGIFKGCAFLCKQFFGWMKGGVSRETA